MPRPIPPADLSKIETKLLQLAQPYRLVLIMLRETGRRAVNSKGAFWFQTYAGALTGELFVELLQKLMYRRKKPVHLVVDSLPAHKKAVVEQ